MSRVVIEDTETYTLSADLREPISPKGIFELRILRRWKQSQDPNYEHREFAVVLDQAGLQKLSEFLSVSS